MATLKRRKKDGGDVNDSWLDLHPDLLTLVFSRLSFIDQPAFHCICKSWRAAALAAGKQHIKQLWLMEEVVAPGRDRRGYCTYKLVNYSSCDKCSYIRDIPCLSNCYFLAAKHGWVLVAWPAEYGRVLKTMFYEPFSLTTIDLPTLNNIPGLVSYCQLNKRWNLFRFDFSAPPTSPECKVVAFFSIHYYWVFTATCSRGQAAWTSADHRGFDCIWLPHRRMVFHEGSFYCIAGVKERHVVGKVLAFHPETNTVQSFSSHPDRAEAMAKRASIPMEKILCCRLRQAAAVNVVERLGGEKLFPELICRDHLVKVSK